MVTNSLSNLLADVAQLTAAIEQATQNQDLDSKETAQNFLEEVLLPAVTEKVDALAYVLNVKLPALIEERKAYLAQVQAWAKEPENQLESIKEYLKYLNDTGKLEPIVNNNSICGTRSKIKFIKSSTPMIDVDQKIAENWSPQQQQEYGEVRVEFKPDKRKLAKAIKEGKELPPGVTYNYVTRIQIKP